MTIRIDISTGELIDKITILEIKLERITDGAKLANIRAEYASLSAACRAAVASDAFLATLIADLKAVNLRLWHIEDDIRDLERAQDFGAPFVALARSVYRTNDERAALKRRINEATNSAIIEEKSYAAY